MLMANADANNNAGELLVWPWTGILAMTTTNGDATRTLSLHAQQHFAGVATTTLQGEETNQHNHFLLLHFGKSWTGLRDAMSLAFHFAGAGRSEWQRQQQRGDDGVGAGRVFGWAAGEEDLLGNGAVGRFLRESGATARSVEDVEKDEASVAVTLGAVVDDYQRREEFLKAKSEEMLKLVQKAEEESSWLHGELRELKNIAGNILPEMDRGVDEDNQKIRAELDAIAREIESGVERIQELKERRTELHCSKVEKVYSALLYTGMQSSVRQLGALSSCQLPCFTASWKQKYR